MGRACGGRTRTRTLDPLIKSQLLYQLSYAPGCWASAQAGRAVAKRKIGVQNGLCTTKHAALWSAPIRGAARHTIENWRNSMTKLTRRVVAALGALVLSVGIASAQSKPKVSIAVGGAGCLCYL